MRFALLVIIVPFLLGASADGDRIDTHVHLAFLAGKNREAFGKEEYAAAAKDLIALMDKHGVTKVVVLPPPSSKRTARAGGGDYADFVDAIAKYPDRLFFVAGGGLLNPMIHETPADRVTSAIRAEFEKRAEEIVAKGARGFGEMTALHLSEQEGHPFEEASPDHPLFLLLADIAAKHDLAIDFHMDAVEKDMDFPARLSILGKGNPARLKANIAAFEKLLAHNAKARIVWQHAGSDPVGGMTPDLLRRLLGAHPNLFVGLRVAYPRAVPDNPRLTNAVLDGDGKVRPEWLKLFTDFHDRFVCGSDTFVNTGAKEGGTRIPFPGMWAFAGKLPPDLAAKIGGSNAARIYGIK